MQIKWMSGHQNDQKPFAQFKDLLSFANVLYM